MYIGNTLVPNPSRIDRADSGLMTYSNPLGGPVRFDIEPGSRIAALRIEWEGLTDDELATVLVACGSLAYNYMKIQTPALRGYSGGVKDSEYVTLRPDSNVTVTEIQETLDFESWQLYDVSIDVISYPYRQSEVLEVERVFTTDAVSVTRSGGGGGAPASLSIHTGGSIAVSDARAVSSRRGPQGSETVTAADAVNVRLQRQIVKAETVTVSDTATLRRVPVAQEQDVIFISEAVAASVV